MVKRDDDTKEESLTEDGLFLSAMQDPDYLESSQFSEQHGVPSRDSLEKADEDFVTAMSKPELTRLDEPVEGEQKPTQSLDTLSGDASRRAETPEVTEEEANLFKDSIDAWVDPIPPKEEDVEKHGFKPGITTKWKAVKSGRLQPDISLDLHHQSEEQAQKSFHGLLNAGRKSPEVALVIVGKGLHSKGKAILRTAIPQWLGGEYSTKVTRWEWAPRHLGGGGAVLILLNRNEEG